MRHRVAAVLVAFLLHLPGCALMKGHTTIERAANNNGLGIACAVSVEKLAEAKGIEDEAITWYPANEPETTLTEDGFACRIEEAHGFISAKVACTGEQMTGGPIDKDGWRRINSMVPFTFQPSGTVCMLIDPTSGGGSGGGGGGGR